MTSSDLFALLEIGDRIVYLFYGLWLTYHFEEVAVIIGNSVNVGKKISVAMFSLNLASTIT